jgi:ribosomal protein L21E
MDVRQRDPFAGKRVFISKDNAGYKGTFGTILEHRNDTLYIQVELVGSRQERVHIRRENCMIQGWAPHISAVSCH